MQQNAMLVFISRTVRGPLFEFQPGEYRRIQGVYRMSLGKKKVRDCRIVLGAVHPTPLLAAEAAASLADRNQSSTRARRSPSHSSA